MTLPQIIHGSTGCRRERRVIFPWLVGVEDDYGGLEIKEWGSWEDISGAHRDLRAVEVGPSGSGHRFGLGSGRYEGAVEIRGVSAVGDALVGARRWDSGSVLRERDAILGVDERKAGEAVEGHRIRMRSAWREAYGVMVELEKAEFGEKSYFRWMEERMNMDVLARAASSVV